jgi:hypothetical protein
VDDFVPHVDRRAMYRKRALDDLDRTVDPGTESPRLREQYFHL